MHATQSARQSTTHQPTHFSHLDPPGHDRASLHDILLCAGTYHCRSGIRPVPEKGYCAACVCVSMKPGIRKPSFRSTTLLSASWQACCADSHSTGSTAVEASDSVNA